MGYKLLQTCIDCDLTGLTDGEWRTLLVICRHADDVTGGNCHPSTQTICKKSRLTEKVVRKAIQSLEANGWIRTSQNPGAVRFFEVDVAKINACLPLASAKEHPRAEVQGDAKEHPRAEVTDNPVQKCTPTPCKSAPLREQLKEQEENSKDTPKPKPAKKEPQGSRFTLEELPDEWFSECRRIQPKADPHKVFEEFRDHWISQPGAKGRKSDWTATWRNWCRRINARDLERVGYEPGRSQFMVKPEPVNPFKVTPQNYQPRQKTEEELEAERSFDLFERVLNGEV